MSDDMEWPICKTCRWSKPSGVDFKVECRRHPPAFRGERAEFPLINDTEWCGEWRMPEPTDIYAEYDRSRDPRDYSWNGVFCENASSVRRREREDA